MYVCMRTKMPGTKYVETKEDEKEDEEDDDDDDDDSIPYVYLLLANKFTNTNTK